MQLIETSRGWEEPAPSHCTACGEALTASRVTVGVGHCRCGIMHRTHHCLSCRATVFTPEPTDKCTLIEGPGAGS